jgi:hypothetical protein
MGPFENWMNTPILVLTWSLVFAFHFCGAKGFPASGALFPKVASAAQPRSSARDRELASLFAPIFYQALGDKPRSDYITNFDFDGDWRGDNNWENSDNDRFPLKAYVYYSVSETATHIFIHYAVFHPRDYKGGERKGAILSELIREGARRGGKYDPTGLALETSLAHENDLEGCLLAVEKNGSDLSGARVAFVETLHHNIFSKYVSGASSPKGYESIKVDGQQVLLYVEPMGHGIQAYDGGEKQTSNKRLVIYKFGGKAEEPSDGAAGPILYDLVPIQTTLWSRARVKSSSLTYSGARDYGKRAIKVLQSNGRTATRTFNIGRVGSAFLGKVGGPNMAKPPWAWADRNDRNKPLGIWFFDPAQTIKLDFGLGEVFSTTYIRPPFWAKTP